MDPLDPGMIFDPQAPRLIGHEGEVLGVVESTMDTVRRRALKGAPDGFVVLAERQRSGRGRKGAWQCPAGAGLLMGILLRMGVRRNERFLLSLLGAVSATEAVSEFVPDAAIKWPNDIVVCERGDQLRIRKLGGVLVEQATQGDAAPAHILGIGLNVGQDHRRLPRDTSLPPTSLKAELGRLVSRNVLCVKVLERLDLWYGKLRTGHAEALLARWRTLSCLLERRVRARVDGEEIEGIIIGLRTTGELILRAAGGRDVLLSAERATIIAWE